MTMGGNDLGPNGGGLGGLIKACAEVTGTCQQDLDPGVKQQLNLLDGTQPGNTNSNSLQQVYGRLREKAPNARILIAGYPHEFTGTYKDSCESINQADQVWMNQVIDLLNGVIQRNIVAANGNADARVEYVDPAPLFKGHEFDHGSSCEWSGQAFVSKAVLTDPFNINGFFHPNALGQMLYANAFVGELRQPSPMSQPSGPSQAATATAPVAPTSDPAAGPPQNVAIARPAPGERTVACAPTPCGTHFVGQTLTFGPVYAFTANVGGKFYPAFRVDKIRLSVDPANTTARLGDTSTPINTRPQDKGMAQPRPISPRRIPSVCRRRHPGIGPGTK